MKNSKYKGHNTISYSMRGRCPILKDMYLIKVDYHKMPILELGDKQYVKFNSYSCLIREEGHRCSLPYFDCPLLKNAPSDLSEKELV